MADPERARTRLAGTRRDRYRGAVSRTSEGTPSSTDSSRDTASLGPAEARAAGWLELVCVGFALLGVGLPLALGAPPFALYRAQLAAAIGEPSLLDTDTTRLVVGITGGSIAGKWVLHWAIVRHGIRARRRWAWNATIAGLAGWWLVDSISSLLGGAVVNVWMINLMPPLLVLPLAARLRSACDAPPEAPRASERGVSRLALGSAVIGIATGAVIAFGTESALFETWWSGLSAAHFDGAEAPPAAHALVRFFAGPIGGSTVGQCAMLAWVARHAIASGERWAWRAGALSVLAWALTDSTWSLVSGGAFNVWLVNLPCAVLLLAPLLWAGTRARPREA